MKKYIIMIVSAMVLVFTSCTNSEEIEIIQTNDIAFEINAQSIYDEFSFTYSIKNLLRDKTYAVGITSFVYDANGSLVDSTVTYTYNLNSVRHSYTSIPEGKYTAVFVQTLVYADNDFLPWDYRLEGCENLSTLEIKQIDAPYWYAVIGVATQEFTLDGSTIQVTPEALGSVINCNFFDFTVSPCVNVAVGTEEIYCGYKLDPSIPEESRYLTKLSASDNFYLLGETDVVEDEERFDIYVLGKSLSYRFYYQTEKNAGTQTWNYLKNTYNADLSTGETTYIGYAYGNDENGTVYNYYGNYSGMLNWYNNLSVERPQPQGALLPSLNLNWGCSVSNVQKTMNGYSMQVGEAGRAIIQNDGSYAIAYDGKGKETTIAYFFTSATTGLYEADVLYPKEFVTSDEILNYLNENYVYLTSQEGIYMYTDKEQTTAVLLFEVDDNWDLGFVDFEYIMSSKVRIPAYSLPQKGCHSHKYTSTSLEGNLMFNNADVVTHANNAMKNIKRK